MSEDQKPAEAPKKDRLIDIYVRLNGDNEKDYCFCLPRDQPVSILYSIFDTLPLVLSPTFFFHRRPIGFHLSTNPGFYTSEGALLFEHSGKETPIDETKRICDVAREGQLFVPIFKTHTRRWVAVVGILLLWLYTDLPEWFTPTPGISLFAIGNRVYEHFFPEIPDPDAPADEHDGSSDWIVDIVFFVFHVLKCSVIFLVFFFGGYNPTSVNPFHEAPDVTADQLRAIGWTGARRITPEEWREENRKRKIEEAGGAVKAYEKGILMSLSTAGISLRRGEGFDTPWGYVRPESEVLPIPEEAPAPAPAVEEAEKTVEAETEKTEEEASAVTTSSDAAPKADTTTPVAPVRKDPFEGIDPEAVLVKLGADYEEKLTKYRRAEISRRMKLGDTVAVALKDWRRIGPVVPPSKEVEVQYKLRKMLEGRPDVYMKTFKEKKNE
ncbi:glucose signaling factor 2-domain-containing protein [Myxozyma melibiosi]|uniref:Glucose signaling factor 2-domain-containing protein n=1 Tax=Myxozyma melibiosi TaxID=54550 RepID=A0ABR1F1U3_9ASCO